MFEVLVILTFFGVLYVEIIEILDKVEQFQAATLQEVDLDY